MKRYFGFWCPWCSTWVDKKDIEVRDGMRFHVDCDNVVDRRSSTVPIQPAPPTKEVLRSHKEHQRMVEDFVREAM